MAVEVSMEAMIRGYHVYRDVWSAVVDEELACKREPFNASDPFAVAVVKGDTTIGHVPACWTTCPSTLQWIVHVLLIFCYANPPPLKCVWRIPCTCCS